MMEYIEIRAFDNHHEASTVLRLLQQHQVRCYLRDEHIRADASLHPVIGGEKLMVHHTQVDRAWDLMEKAEQQFLRQIPCPVCHAHTLKAISITRHHRSRLSALASMVLNGHSVELAFVYQCSSCGYDFKELPRRN